MNNYFISRKGNDETGDGSELSPWQTMTRVATTVTPGDNITIEDGIYKDFNWEDIEGTVDQPITVQARNTGCVVFRPGKQIKINKNTNRWKAENFVSSPNSSHQTLWSVILNGTETEGTDYMNLVVQDFRKPFIMYGLDQAIEGKTASGKTVYTEDFQPKYGTDRAALGDLDPMANQEIGYGGFRFIPDVDPANGGTLWVGIEHPWYKYWTLGTTSVDVLRLSRCKYINIKGLIFEGPDKETDPMGQMCLIHTCDGINMESCSFKFAAHKCLGIYLTQNCNFTDIECAWGGAVGVSMNQCENVQWDRLWAHHNGYRYKAAWGIMAGMKNIPKNQACNVSNSIFEDNEGNGLWWDDSNINCQSNNCIYRRNGESGLHIELGSSYITSNKDKSYQNRGRGIYVSRGCNNVVILNATCVDNVEGITVNNTESRGFRNTNVSILHCVVCDNDYGDVFISDPRITGDQGHKCECNSYGPNYKLYHPWITTPTHTPIEDWQARGYDLDSDFTDPIPYRISSNGISIQNPK